jgi:hypothetical protein
VISLAFGPIYVAGAALLVGFLLILALGRPRKSPEKPAEGGRRGRASGSAAVKDLEASVEKKAEFLVHMGFTEIDWIADEKTPGVTAFRARNPMPLSGGDYLIHFLAEPKGGAPIGSERALEFRSIVKHEEGVLKGILVTAGAFTEEAFAALASAPVELIDGKQLESLLRMFYPARFPKERL